MARQRSSGSGPLCETDVNRTAVLTPRLIAGGVREMSDPFADCGQCRSALRLFSNLKPKVAAEMRALASDLPRKRLKPQLGS
jgi:hypothetical protein